MDTAFQQLAEAFEKEQELKESMRNELKALDKTLRDLQTCLLRMHCHDPVPTICANAEQLFPQLRAPFLAVGALIPPGMYYRYNDMWRWHAQQTSFLLCMWHFLKWTTSSEGNFLLSLTDMQKLLNLPEEQFHIDLEDYLSGLCFIPQELSRFCTNSVINEDFATPFKVSQFVGDLFNSFRMLNLKNDFLRKRYDGMKYDVKRIEEIVYDLQIRDLHKKA